MKPEYLGARASNTGDDFHEWWALRLALQLLAPGTSLTAVTVEGVNLDNKNSQDLTNTHLNIFQTLNVSVSFR